MDMNNLMIVIFLILLVLNIAVIIKKVLKDKKAMSEGDYEFISVLANKIDAALNLYDRAMLSVNENDSLSEEEFKPKDIKFVFETLIEFMNRSMDIYYFYENNGVLYKFLDPHINKINTIFDSIKNNLGNDDLDFTGLNYIYFELLQLKKKCGTYL